MFTDSQLEILHGLLVRRQDPAINSQDYTDLLHMVESEQRVRRSSRRKASEYSARRSAVEAPSVPDIDPLNDPSKW